MVSSAATLGNARSQVGRILCLDGVRACAILCVLFSHAMWQATGSYYLAPIGHFGVLLFFALSGYLITLRLLHEFEQHGSISLRQFYLRRAFRILPPALTYLAILSLLTWLGVVICTGQSIRAALFFYVNYINVGTLGWRAGHFWSLSVEEHFYLFWPLLLVLCKVRRGWIGAAVLAVVVNIWRNYARHHNLMDPSHYTSVVFRTDSIADTLLWGCCLAFIRVRLPQALAALLVVGATLLQLALMFPEQLPHLQRFLPQHVLPIQQFLPSVILAGVVLADSSSLIVRTLAFKPLRWLGLISYSLYIWQEMFLNAPGLHWPVLWSVCAALVAACLSYYLIETPSIAFGKRLIGSTRPAPEPRLATSSESA